MQNWIRTRLAVAAAGFSTVAPVIAQAAPGEGWSHPSMMWGGGWFMGPLMMLVWLAVIVALAVFVLRLMGGASGDTSQRPNPSARKILEERFARGEIDQDEFRKRKRALEE